MSTIEATASGPTSIPATIAIRAVESGAREISIRQTVMPDETRPWVCRPEIAPRVRAEGDTLVADSNGSEGCYGGWEIVYRAAEWPAERLQFEIDATASDLPRGLDCLVIEAFWDNAAGEEIEWDPITVQDEGNGGQATQARMIHAHFAEQLRVPAEGRTLRVRCGLRWSAQGSVRWHGWRLSAAPASPAHRRLRVGVASAHPGPWVDVATNTAHYLEQCRLAGEAGIDLVCLPELMLTYGMPASPEAAHAAAQPVPGDWLQPFQEIARRYEMGICFSTYERAGEHGEIVYNTAVLLGRDGSFIGKYRKVHLALAEARKGVAAGHEFPVFDFHGVRVGMAICMDSTPLETSRILARQGAEIMLMPIMGDFRATPWIAGNGKFHRERWETVQRAHALDNHLYVVTSRNTTQGSAITAPWGEILAYDDGTKGIIWADADVDDVRSHPRGSTIRSVIWSMRRPAVYTPLFAPAQVP